VGVGPILTELFSIDVPRGTIYNLDTLFGRLVPKNLLGQKIVQNSARFLTTFDFDREYLRNGSTYRKWEKLLIIYNLSHVG